MVGRAQRVGPLAAMLAAIWISAAAARPEARPEPSKDAGVPIEQQPYYYDRLLVDGDFKNASIGFMRLLRNTIYAKAGRPFKDPIWREYFEQQPWYHARPEGAVKLSATDEANLRTIKRWEANLLEAQVRGFDSTFQSLVPRGPSAALAGPARSDCEADARGVLADRKLEDKLVALSARVRWPDLKDGRGFGYDYLSQGYVETRARGVRLACLPDLDGDGIPESVVAIIYPHWGGPDDIAGNGTYQLTFLVSGKGPGWRSVAPLAITGEQMGVEGHVWARVELARLEDGRWGLAVRTSWDACCDEECDGYVVRRFSLKNGKLAQVGRPAQGKTCY